MVRIFRPQKADSPSSPLETPLVTGFIKFELIAGAFFLMLGGFVLRAQNSYVLILVGGTLFCLGLFRLWQRSQLNEESPIEDDRILRVLQHRLNPNYTVVVNYPVSEDESIPYLVMGPPGVFVLRPWSVTGEVEESSSDRKWIVRREDGSDENVLNPVVENERLVQKLRDSVDKPGLLKPLHHFVVLLGRRADCPPLENEHVLEMNDLAGELLVENDDEKRLDWEDVDDLEQLLNLKD